MTISTSRTKRKKSHLPSAKIAENLTTATKHAKSSVMWNREMLLRKRLSSNSGPRNHFRENQQSASGRTRFRELSMKMLLNLRSISTSSICWVVKACWRLIRGKVSEIFDKMKLSLMLSSAKRCNCCSTNSRAWETTWRSMSNNKKRWRLLNRKRLRKSASSSSRQHKRFKNSKTYPIRLNQIFLYHKTMDRSKTKRWNRTMATSRTNRKERPFAKFVEYLTTAT